MLRLGEHIQRHPIRIGAPVTNDQDFRWAGHHVDTHASKHLALGGRHVDIAGADDLIHCGHGSSAASQGCNGLGTTNSKNSIDTGNIGGRENQVIDFAARSRDYHNDFVHPSHFGGQGVHQNGRGITGFATRNINSHPFQRGDSLTEQVARVVIILPALL